MSTGENWSGTKIFHSRCAIETIEEEHLEKQDNMLNNKLCSMSHLLAQLLFIQREFTTLYLLQLIKVLEPFPICALK